MHTYLLYMMSTTFNLICTQQLDITDNKTLITFSTQTITGHVHYFHLTRNQFFALDDAFAVIDTNCGYTDFPLGQNIWLHYKYHKAVIYDTTHHGQSYFKFMNVQLYRRRIHRRVLSFLRSRSKPTVTPSRGVKRRRITCEDDYNSCDEGQGTNRQRPLSVAMRPTSEPSSIKGSTARGSTVHGPTHDAVMSADGKARAVLPQRNDSSVGRQHDINAFRAAPCDDLRTPDIFLDESGSSDCDSCLTMDCE